MSEHPAKSELALARIALRLAVRQLAAASSRGLWRHGSTAAVINIEADLTAKLEVVEALYRRAQNSTHEEAL